MRARLPGKYRALAYATFKGNLKGLKREQNIILDKELAKEQYKKYVPFLFIVLFLLIVVALITDIKPTSSEVVMGTAVNYRSTLHDEGHDIDIYVQLEDKEKPVRVRLPKKVPILIGSKVALNKVYRDNSDYKKFIFLRYIDD